MLQRIIIGYGMFLCAMLMIAHVAAWHIPTLESIGTGTNSPASGMPSNNSGGYNSTPYGGYYSTPSRGSGGAFSWGGGK